MKNLFYYPLCFALALFVNSNAFGMDSLSLQLKKVGLNETPSFKKTKKPNDEKKAKRVFSREFNKIKNDLTDKNASPIKEKLSELIKFSRKHKLYTERVVASGRLCNLNILTAKSDPTSQSNPS
ncbi:hypothetical protein HYX58_00850 [Candidatus Dependentiae bacterium]|nr:hypothetical protein [Candidatus Dependentiae bacterium]